MITGPQVEITHIGELALRISNLRISRVFLTEERCTGEKVRPRDFFQFPCSM